MKTIFEKRNYSENEIYIGIITEKHIENKAVFDVIYRKRTQSGITSASFSEIGFEKEKLYEFIRLAVESFTLPEILPEIFEEYF